MAESEQQDLRSLLMALQGNLSHLQGTLRQLGAAHNVIVEDILEIAEEVGAANLEVDSKLTLAQHLAIGDASPHHEPVTVGVGLDVAGQLVTLDLSEVSAGGELGGTLDSPTVDATHSGSTHGAATAAHEADALDAHDASAISVISTTLTGTGADVQAVLEELDDLLNIVVAGLADHLSDSGDAHDASAISFDPTGLSVVTATEVQTAIEELDAASGGGGGGGSNAFAFFIS